MKLKLTDYAPVQAYCGNISGNELMHNLSGNTQPQSSQLADPPWTDPGLKIISTLKKKKKKKKKHRHGMNCQTFSPKSLHVRKKPPPQYTCITGCTGGVEDKL